MNQELRILNILKKLSSHKVICTQQLVSEFMTTQRTIQRDMQILRSFIGGSLHSPQRGCYQLLNNHYFLNILQNNKETKRLKEFFEFLAIFDIRALEFLKGEELSYLHTLTKESSQIYTIFESPIEALQKTAYLTDMKHAIKHRQYCDIIYNEKEPLPLKNIKPQKILYAKNNWYLAVISREHFEKNDGFRLLRINFIEDFRLTSKTFHLNIQAQKHIEQMQSLFQDFNSPNYEVCVRVSCEVSRHFRVKRYLSSQTILSTEENGDLILSFSINNDMEIIPLIKTWLPHLKVISPKYLDKKIKKEISRY
jgi:predicted DNA-binding transcriptional regulator YafY